MNWADVNNLSLAQTPASLAKAVENKLQPKQQMANNLHYSLQQNLHLPHAPAADTAWQPTRQVAHQANGPVVRHWQSNNNGARKERQTWPRKWQRLHYWHQSGKVLKRVARPRNRPNVATDLARQLNRN
jgi:hypothetical protein